MKFSPWSRTVGLAGLGALALGTQIAAAHAGDLEWDNAPALGAAGVRDRTRAAFEPDGIRIGNFLMRSEVGYSLGWTKDSLSSGPSPDIRHNVTTALDVRSDWQRHFLEIAVQGNAVMSQEQSDLRYLDSLFRVRGRIDIDHATSLFGEAKWEQRHEENLDEERPTGTSQPTPFTVLHAEVGLQRTQGRFDFAVGSRFERYDYASFTTNDGALVDQSARNYSLLEPFARLGYRLSPGYKVFSEFALDDKAGSGMAGGSRSARGVKATGGAEFELSPLVKVTAFAGYKTETFDQPGLVDIAALIWSARLDWYVTPLMTISLASGRDIQETSFGTASGRAMTTYSAKADYELLRNLILSAEGRLSLADYVGETRHDQIMVERISAEYLMSKHWLLTLAAEHQQLKSDAADQDRTLDKVTVGAKYRF